ncbi:MAG: hypothetical protein AAFV95_14230 [Bacteroidota bacterium]
MRIVGNIDHPSMKITIFQMDNKLSVKFETGLYEQTYKFRAGDQTDTSEDMRELVDAEFQQAVLEQFQQLHRLKMQALNRRRASEGERFEEII